ncbi:hypothetical protein L1887_16546 [Cichorium endivia]|nr:hypothetical protein L1887_16546 [Cichorium endivia]
MREELALKAAILAKKFAPDLSWYVDVILQLIDKAGDFFSDVIWFSLKAREYLDKPAIHETIVSAYLPGEYSHLLARRPGCSPKEIFSIIYEKLPTVSTPTISILLTAYAKILMHSQPPDPELQNQIWAVYSKIRQVDLKFPSKPIVSAAAKDLISQMLVKDSSNRLPLHNLLEHPWIVHNADPTGYTFSILMYSMQRKSP